MFDFLDSVFPEMSTPNTDDTSVEESALDEMTEEEEAMMEAVEAIDCPEDDLADAIARVNMETLDNYHRIVEAVMLDEFNEYINTNEEVVYEEGRVKKVVGTIKAAIQKAWAKVKGIFKKFFAWLSQMVGNDSKWLDAHKKELNKYKGSVKIKGYPFDKIDDCSMYGKISSKFEKSFGDVKKYIIYKGDNEERISSIKGAKAAMSGGSSTMPNLEKYSEELKSAVVSSYKSGGDFSKELKKFFYGADDPYDITISNVGSVVSALKGADKQKKAANKAYKDCEKFFNKLMKEADKLASQISSKLGEAGSGATRAIGAYNKACSESIAVANQVLNVQLGAIKSSYNMNKKVARQVVGGYETKANNESALDLLSFI